MKGLAWGRATGDASLFGAFVNGVPNRSVLIRLGGGDGLDPLGGSVVRTDHVFLSVAPAFSSILKRVGERLQSRAHVQTILIAF